MTDSPLALADAGLLRAQSYIGGHWRDADGGARFPVRDPADRSLIIQVADAGATDTDRAIDAAARALPAWRAVAAKERSRTLRRWFDLMLEHREDLARLLSREQGKPLAESRGEIDYAASFIEWFAEEAKRVNGELLAGDQPGRRLATLKQPVGVVAAITPWNFPCAMVTRKAGPALAAGCTLVLKPDPETPLSALALAELARRAGLPAGVFNVVPGRDAAAIGARLTGDRRVRKLSFTGSTAVGKLLMAQCADTVKKLSLELGGNAPFIVFDDANLDAAVEGALASKFRNSGQTCVCTNRFLVQDGVHDAFCDKLARAVEALKVGPAGDEHAQQGPLIHAGAVDKVRAHVDDALAGGARLLCGGEPHALGGGFFQPTVLSGVTPSMRVAREETFGPLAPVFRFRDEGEALALANDTPSGLAAYVYSGDLGRAWRLAEALEYGMVGINEGIISTELAPFGGIKESGLGREGSRHGIDDYLELKYLCVADP
ncbi:MAG: NAD-dependent succinate-semialdehyde dehydrogenase [Alcanivorax sp.]|nr:NAD-dependent succinate-semialdehyde dehydrogenase [Alcanivorax sp.]